MPRKPRRKPIKVGPWLETWGDTNMQSAFDTDVESGSHWMNEAKSDLLNKEFPTTVAMSLLIEKERNRLRRQVQTLLRILKQRTKGQ